MSRIHFDSFAIISGFVCLKHVDFQNSLITTKTDRMGNSDQYELALAGQKDCILI